MSETLRLPSAIRLLNAGGRLLSAAGAKFPAMQEGSLLSQAAEQAGLTDFGDDLFREGLGRLLPALEEEAGLSTLGRIMAKDSILHDLVARLEMTECRKRLPGIDQEEVRRPLFIVGLPRTGTTLLYNLLARDPKHRVPLGWEVIYPCPPPESESYLTDPRIDKAKQRYAQVQKLSPNLQAIHPVGAQLPEECSTITAREFQSRNYDYVFDIPSYHQWYVNRPQVDIYEAHRRYLQHLQFRAKKERWLLKAPQHLPFIRDLYQVYPDAEIIFTHRDPTEIMPSMASLIYHMRFLTRRSVDRARIGREQVERWSWALDQCEEARAAMPHKAPQMADLRFSELIRSPMTVVEQLYAHFGWPIDDEIRARMRGFLSQNPRNKHGIHKYSLEMFQLSATEVKDRFASYRERA
ncbi:MAG: sulfotransferase [Polyangiales bacterium]